MKCPTCAGSVYVRCRTCRGNGTLPDPPKKLALLEVAEHEEQVREARILLRLEAA